MAKKKAASKKTGRKKSGKKRTSKKATSKKTSSKKTGKKKRGGKKRGKKKSVPIAFAIGMSHESKALADKNAALQARLNKANIAKENAEQAARMARLTGKKKPRRSKKKASSALTKVGKKRKSSAVQTISANDIIKGAREQSMTAWICAGPKRTGCGGGKRGGHVIAGLSAPRRMKR